jgi:hypothetical protein
VQEALEEGPGETMEISTGKGWGKDPPLGEELKKAGREEEQRGLEEKHEFLFLNHWVYKCWEDNPLQSAHGEPIPRGGETLCHVGYGYEAIEMPHFSSNREQNSGGGDHRHGRIDQEFTQRPDGGLPSDLR